MGDKIERCRICFRKFKKEDTKYTVGLASFDHCDYNVRWRGDEKVIRLSKKASYRRIIANVCESCVTLASIEEVLGFGKKLRTKNYIPFFFLQTNTVLETRCYKLPITIIIVLVFVLLANPLVDF